MLREVTEEIVTDSSPLLKNYPPEKLQHEE
jgi:hypothetical protein